MDENRITEVIQDAQARAIAEHNNLPGYQQHLDISVSLFIIGIGLFQYVFRKWILLVPEDIIFELEDQWPSQGIIYHPGLGIFIMVVGVISLVLFNLEVIF